MTLGRLVAFIQRLLLTALLLWSMGVALLDAYGLQDEAQPADVIVVLGARVYPSGRAGPSLTRRVQHAVALYRRGLAAAIICSGGTSADNAISEGEVACGLAAAAGVPPEALLVETHARNTEENALLTAALMRARGWTSAIVVSDGYHLYRAALLFERAGIRAYPSPAQVTVGPMRRVERWSRASRELAALAWYWGKAWLRYPATDFPY